MWKGEIIFVMSCNKFKNRIREDILSQLRILYMKNFNRKFENNISLNLLIHVLGDLLN